MNHPPMSSDSATIDSRVSSLVETWQRKMIDLTRHNRALNFRPTRVSTVAVVDEQPAEVFRRLLLRKQPMRFRALEPEPEPEAFVSVSESGSKPVPDAPAAAVAAEDPDGPQDVLEDDDAVVEAADFVPYEAAAPHEKHTDEWLQAASPPETLDKSLRRIDEMARVAIEEQGVNTLYLSLGMLHYTDRPEEDGMVKAPLVMLPVALTRKSARSGYTLRTTDDDPLVNPALVELLRRDHRLPLPELPASEAMQEDYDLRYFFAQVEQAVADQEGWSVKSEIHLALFSFQKLVMYKDLETHAAAAARHRLVRQLATREGSVHIGLPAEVRALDLDREFPPEATFQVVDADASQLRAMAAVAREHDLVIEGPPGTGKSQTITNLIATTLAAGRSVLFVAEKQAALSVVHNRLLAAGLGEFCLELHAAKANKRAVLRQVGEALDASLERVEATHDATQRLPAVRSALTSYVRAAHAPFGALQCPPFRAYGEFLHVLDAPRFPYDGAAEEVSAAQFEEAIRALDTLAAAAADLGRAPAGHPWQGATKTFYLPTDLEEIETSGTTLAKEFDALAAEGAAVAAEFGFPAIDDFALVADGEAVAAILGRSPGVAAAVLESDSWDQPPRAALQLIERGRELAKLRTRIEGMFIDAALEREHAGDAAFVEERLGGTLSFLAGLNGRFRAIRKRWNSYRRVGYNKPLVEQAADLRLVDGLQRDRMALGGNEAGARALFGGHWRGEASDWEALAGYVGWVGEFRAVCRRHELITSRAAAIAANPTPDVSSMAGLAESARSARRKLARFAESVGWPAGHLEDEPFPSISQRLAGVAGSTALAPRWAAFEAARRNAERGPARAFAEAAIDGRLAFSEVRRAFVRAFYARWLAACLRSRPELERFNTLGHEERVGEFRRLDAGVLLENRAVMVAQLRDRVQARLKSADAAPGMPLLRRELARQRGHQPLRRTMHEAGAAIRAIKPCFMMSPLTVAQYLDGDTPGFDLVIFDEASQLPAEDAAGAIIRGRQLVVVGDPKQLPPTTFFTGSGRHEPGSDEQGAPFEADPESILEDFMGTGMPACRLKWHYRSAHESLISFSNMNFYDGELLTFPSVETEAEDRGLRFEFVEGGVYEGKGLNLVEARRVADAVVEFARRQLEHRAPGEAAQTLGVGTFNLRQQLAIQDELELRRREDPALEPFFDRDADEPFFVKNLENIQGDERDVIFLSVTYGRSPDGKLRRNFGPLNGDNGWRRLNVLTTRARRHMQVFASMRGDEIELTAEPTPGPRLLREFLLFAERGRLEGGPAGAGAENGSPLERDVARELTQRGLKLVPRVGVAGYRIDLGVLDQACPGRFLCGIECDGAAYHASETARDRDRLRQQVLELRGWAIFRVWSTSWFLDRHGQVERLLGLIEGARRQAVESLDAARRAREASELEAAALATAEAGQAQLDAEEARKLANVPYVRPRAEAYAPAAFDEEIDRGELLAAPDSQVVQAVVAVVEAETPIHHVQLCSRVAAMWGTRPGSRIAQKVSAAAESAERGKLIRSDGEFWHRQDARCRVRSRAGTRMKAEHIAPEEYAAAILMILGQGHGFHRDQLVSEVRAVLGFSRAGPMLDEAVRTVVDNLLNSGKIGEGSTGIKLRR